MKKSKNLYLFVPSEICCRARNYTVYWVFKRGRILPVALLKHTDKNTEVCSFKGIDDKDIQSTFKQIYGCS